MKLFGLGVPELLIILAVILLEGMGAGKKEKAPSTESADEVVVETIEAPEPIEVGGPAAEGAAPKTVRKVVVKKKAE